MELDDLKKVVVSLLAENSDFTAERMADGLIGAGILTQWQAGKLLAGKSKGFYLGSYRLLRPLGRGGMGVVYLGEHHVMKRLMALIPDLLDFRDDCPAAVADLPSMDLGTLLR